LEATFYAEIALYEVVAPHRRHSEEPLETPIGPGPTGMNLDNIKNCARCGLRYDWRKSPSTLKMTYCGSLCEFGDLGFTVDALLRLERAPRPEQAVEAPEPAAV
jgi:hypothetical protein